MVVFLLGVLFRTSCTDSSPSIIAFKGGHDLHCSRSWLVGACGLDPALKGQSCKHALEFIHSYFEC